VRARQRGNTQYEKMARREAYHMVREYTSRLLINVHDYHDCGLFLDHRKVRQKIHKMAQGKHFLNLFAYTGAASVHAALGGAQSVTTVDMSNAYLAWAQRNFAANDLSGEQYHFVREDCLVWLANASVEQAAHYDVILLDPPTFSNSKRMSDTWDVQRDHESLISQTMRCLSPGGTLIFSCNRQRFKLDDALEKLYHCREISKQTVPRDFSRHARIHRCWEIRHRTEDTP